MTSSQYDDDRDNLIANISFWNSEIACKIERKTRKASMVRYSRNKLKLM